MTHMVLGFVYRIWAGLGLKSFLSKVGGMFLVGSVFSTFQNPPLANHCLMVDPRVNCHPHVQFGSSRAVPFEKFLCNHVLAQP